MVHMHPMMMVVDHHSPRLVAWNIPWVAVGIGTLQVEVVAAACIPLAGAVVDSTHQVGGHHIEAEVGNMVVDHQVADCTEADMPLV